MLHRLNNLFNSLRTYGTLSPDLVVRRQVNRVLGDRRALTQDEWFEVVCKPWGIAYPVATFVYSHLGQYSGLQFGRVAWSDRLDEDLQWTRVCWFDWADSLCNDFWQCFEIDIRDCLDEFALETVGDLVEFLNEQLMSTSDIKIS